MFENSVFSEQQEYDGRVLLKSYKDALLCLKYKLSW